ncbi:mechanosensitive ion channel family protein [Pantoea sp. Nvir]|uniref:DUF3772 domain-containing protein n=1 Tax=Pantoea sp. Nvir TaxID=2576760 RepID=UPI00135995FF|nr:mechanosensitive ion channel domain-containing protein [Pantoea sp. Nvir]MXP66307.1 mechanosensitive ion channel family protein [Pantoea sp. Nvir]
MLNLRFFSLLLMLLAIVALFSSYNLTNADTQNSDVVFKVNEVIELTKMQKILDKIKYQVLQKINEDQMIHLKDMALELVDKSNALATSLQLKLQQLDSQLTVLGPETIVDGVVKETPEVTRKRHFLKNQKSTLDSQIKQVEGIKYGAMMCSSQISTLHHNLMKTQLAFNSGSIFSARFWAPLFMKKDIDKKKIDDFLHALKDTATLSWESDSWFSTIAWLLGALLVMILGCGYSEDFVTWISIHKIPAGHLRRSFLASAIVLTNLTSVVLTVNFIALALVRHDKVSNNVQNFVSSLLNLSFFCGMIVGLGRAFLSMRRPSWRLPAISNEMAIALKPFPLITAVLIFIIQTIEYFNYIAGTSFSSTIFTNGLTALLIGSTALVIIIRTNRVQRCVVHEENTPTPSTLIGIIQMALILTTVVILMSLTIGYVTFARYLSYEMIWCGIMFGSFYFLSHLFNDVCKIFFSINSFTGKWLHHSLNIHERHLQQAETLLVALGKTMLISFVALVLLTTGTFSSLNPIEVLQKAIDFWCGKGLESLNIIPVNMVNAFITLVVGIYVLRSVCRWLDSNFLPKTTMDTGIRVSFVTLFSNIGYVLVILLTLSIIGIQWNKLAWIVSALSVGIGFGLQEIVKNFISGLILLTERPINVGDLVTISGIKGDIHRINVRATEIRLSDKSTVIVPNSQFISQNVRNVTMGNAQGIVTIMLTFPLNIDPVIVRNLLLKVYKENHHILDIPEPSVSFKALTSQGIMISITGNVVSQRHISVAKSDLLFEILMRMRKEGIVLSTPQNTFIE